MRISNLSLLKKLIRTSRIWLILIKLIFLLFWDKHIWSFFKRPNHTEILRKQSYRAKWITNELLRLGSAFIKVGQLLSSRPDILPKTWIKELSSLQDEVPRPPGTG